MNGGLARLLVATMNPQGSVLASIPIAKDLLWVVVGLFIMNALLTGLVILLAWQAAQLRERVAELEAGGAEQVQDEAPVATPAGGAGRVGTGLGPLSDDRPIPTVRHAPARVRAEEAEA